MNTDITFIIADNQDITRMGMHGYISAIFSGCRMIDVTDKKELMLALVECNDSVVILDYTLFDINGIEEFLIIEKRFPRVRWILFSNELSEDFIRRMSIERNIGMILKENSGEEIHSALMCTAHGERFLCHQITNLLIIGSDKPEIHSVLTVTEIDILKLIAHGKSVKEIALERTSSIHTIITHKKNIFRKLGVNNVYVPYIWVRERELEHKEDQEKWPDQNIKKYLEEKENEVKKQEFKDEHTCLDKRELVIEELRSSVLKVLENSYNKWDKSGKHVWGHPNQIPANM